MSRVDDVVDPLTGPSQRARCLVDRRWRKDRTGVGAQLVLEVDVHPRAVFRPGVLALELVRYASRPAPSLNIVDVRVLGEQAETVDRSVGMWRKVQIGITHGTSPVEPATRAPCVGCAEDQAASIARLGLRSDVAREAKPECDLLRLCLGELDQYRGAVGGGGIPVDVHQHRRKISRCLQLALQVLQALRVIRIGRLDRIEPFDQRGIVSPQPGNAGRSEPERRSAVDRHVQCDGGCLGIDLSTGCDDPGCREIPFLHPREQQGLGLGPIGVSKGLAGR